MNDITVASWNELNDCLYHGAWQAPIRRFRSNFAFRGMSDASDNLETSLMRLGSGYEGLESHLLRAFRRYAQQFAVPADSIWNWLAVGQHHGLPTRLLDWTHSPYVALHFATANDTLHHVDGVVWCVNYVQTNRFLPERLQSVLREEGADVFTAEMLAAVAGTLPEYDRLATDEFVAFFEPPSLDERIVNQFALFSLMSAPTARMDHWLSGNPDCFHRMIIPAALKPEARDKLDQINITERVLFPGLDGLSLWLKRYYRPVADIREHVE